MSSSVVSRRKTTGILITLLTAFLVLCQPAASKAVAGDTDGDGIPDSYETSHGLDPLNAGDASLDNDHDGSSNLAEYLAWTNPANRDTDGDTITDGYELSHGMNPLDPSDASLDNDQDGSSNLSEYHSGSAPDSHDNSIDGDGDGIPNTDEDAEDSDSEVQDSEHNGTVTSGSSTNPYSAGLDADGDGFSNLEEYVGHSNPNSSTSVPASQSVMDNNNQPIRMVTPPNITVNSFTWVDPATMPQSTTPGVSFPYGMISFDLTVTTPGEHIKVALTFPGPVDPLSSYDHFGATITNPTGQWVSYTVGSNDGDATIILNLADGSDIDDDMTADGTIHDPGGPALLSNAQMANISTRSRVQTGANVMIGGFIISGTSPRSVLIRGFGPTLADFGVTDAMANPYLELYSGQTMIATNDNWQTPITQCDAPAVSCGTPQEIQATGKSACSVATTGCTQDAAILVTLPPGAYTAMLKGVGGGTGVGLVGVDDNDTSTSSKLINISTRSQVQTGSNVLIGGVIVSGTTPKSVLIRAFGPTMGAAPYNVPGILSNPTIKLYSGPTVIAQNDDWQTTDPLCAAPAIFCGGASAIKATGMNPCKPNPGQTTAPANCSKESALYVTLPPGAYTAIVSGVGGTTGVGLVGVDEIGQ